MKRKIVQIHEDKCNGCGLCVNACHEGALELINGKAVLLSDVYCDGLGDCLPQCPVDAIEIIERDAEEFDKELVERRMEERKQQTKQEQKEELPCGCPGQRAKVIAHKAPAVQAVQTENTGKTELQSELRQWPVQIKLVSPNAPYFDGSHILVAADCTAFAYANIHEKFMKGKITLIGCPKLDDVDYSEKLASILKNNDVKSITVLRMEVPCCSGIVNAVKNAIINSGKMIPWGYKIVTTDGNLIEE